MVAFHFNTEPLKYFNLQKQISKYAVLANIKKCAINVLATDSSIVSFLYQYSQLYDHHYP